MTDIRLSSRNTPIAQNACYQGGTFFDAVGDEFDALVRRHDVISDDVISDDVLDAWFDPAPRVIDALAAHRAWTLRPLFR
ncbi:MAG TPA: hypothetical protein VN677_12380 [Gemmatimonadaceae bacterium]|nr:hypothetical protein [Gemmatimonadaceae bacterium]